MHFLFILSCLSLGALAVPTPKRLGPRAAVRPQVKHTTIIANVTDPAVSRDSCGSSRVGDRAFWTCRDTSLFNAEMNQCTTPIVPTTASWTNQSSNGPAIQQGGAVGPGSTGSNSILQMYGVDSANLTPYFPIPDTECPSNGMCDDSTRYVNWPDSPPAITYSSEAGFVGYTFSPRAHLQGLAALDAAPAHTLYKSFYMASSDPNMMPFVSAVDLDFWKAGEFGYGRYGSFVKDGYLYLYGQNTEKQTSLAKVPVTSVEDRSAYTFYVNGAWTPNMPSMTDSSAFIPNINNGQGTFYYSSAFSSYIWIGQSGLSVSADFLMSTAPSPEGPWIEPYQIYSGQNGDSSLGSYSLQAHPALLPSEDKSEKGIYLTWTQQWLPETYPGVYVTPLLWMEFE